MNKYFIDVICTKLEFIWATDQVNHHNREEREGKAMLLSPGRLGEGLGQGGSESNELHLRTAHLLNEAGFASLIIFVGRSCRGT